MPDSPADEPIYAPDAAPLLSADAGSAGDPAVAVTPDGAGEPNGGPGAAPNPPAAAALPDRDPLAGVRDDITRQEQQQEPRPPGLFRRVTRSLTGILRRSPEEPPPPPDRLEPSPEPVTPPSGEPGPFTYPLEPAGDDAHFERLLREEAAADLGMDLLAVDSPATPDLPVEEPPDPSDRLNLQPSLTAQLTPFALEDDGSDDIYAQKVFASESETGDEDQEPEWLPRGAAALKTGRGQNVVTHILPPSEEDEARQPVFLPDDDPPPEPDLPAGGGAEESPAPDMPALRSPMDAVDLRAGLILPDDDEEPPPPPPEPPAEPQEKPAKNLRTFFTGILRPSEVKKAPGDGSDLDERVVTDRLNASLGPDRLSEPSGSSRIRRAARTGVTGPLLEPNRDPVLPQDDIDSAEDALWVGGTRTFAPRPLTASEQPVSPFIGEEEPGDRPPAAALPDGQSTLAARLATMTMRQPSDAQDAAAEWEGEGVRTRSLSTAPDTRMDEMRSLVLETYADETPDRLPQEMLRDREGFPGAEPGPRRWWWSTLSRLERILLIVFAMVAVSVTGGLAYLLTRPEPLPPPVVTRPSGEQVSGAPVPSGLKLAGGWFFPLERNTIVDGKWKPVAAEWLEGSEVRRVIAIPWNAQTEAVIQTFGKGDEFELYFDNNDLIVYTVNEVKRVPVGDVSIFQDRRPTLAVVLYQEESDERWVVVCSPR